MDDDGTGERASAPGPEARRRPEGQGARPGGRGGGSGRPRLGPGGALVRFLFWAIFFLFFFRLAQGGLFGDRDRTAIPYSTFRTEVSEGNVVEVTLRGDRVTGLLREPVERVVEGDTLAVGEFLTYVPAFGDAELLALLREQRVEVTTLPEADTSWVELLIWGLLPILLLGGLVLLLSRGMAARASSFLSIGKSGAKEYVREDSATTFDDVAGAAGAKRELREIVLFLEDPDRFHRVGAEVPKGVLLVGPPGTGKTLLARAVAGEADVSFLTITGSDFMEMFVGVGAKRVRSLFAQAKSAAPSIVFIDELDSIGRRRGAGLGGGHDEREQTLNQLLSELDGFEPAENVIVMAATNRPDILDPALLRPGRFDRRITVDLPAASERLEILRLHARHLPMDPDVDLEPVARATPGFSGADLKNLLNEAALAAARSERETIVGADLEAARDRVLLGLEREGLALTDDEVRLLAYHEAGHALVGSVLPSADPVHKVTIVPRGRSMGSTHAHPERERYVWRREELMDRIATMLGGRAAEELAFGSVTSGAQDDLDQATRLARRMVLRWGMSPALGAYSEGSAGDAVFLGETLSRAKEHSEATAELADREVRRLLTEASERAADVLQRNREDLDRLAEALVEKEELDGPELRRLLDLDTEEGGPGPSEPATAAERAGE